MDVALRPRAGAVLGPLVGVAVGEPGDADDRAEVELMAADSGGHQRVAQGRAVRLLPGVEDADRRGEGERPDLGGQGLVQRAHQLRQALFHAQTPQPQK
ncbi:hypothetical protein ACFVH0_32500 [Streptomyces sp. NPDC127117]|uniref:hypothetical protein n=1 Tax=Streptomyces sp. NPDC127117 TaxID=3345368 RepID=UPI00362A89A4